MPDVVVEIARPPEVCWRALIDPPSFAAWMPGLRRARIITTDAAGLPLEVAFEYSKSLTYSLVYEYDVPARAVRWQPRVGAREAVRGSAKIDAIDLGARLTYHLEQGAGRVTGDLVLGGAHPVVAAFKAWIERG